MRQGVNPQKNKSVQQLLYTHQLVVPVYIPNHEDFFKDAFKIFKLSMDSAFKTIHSKTYITIVNNGSCEVVVDYLHELYSDGKIHEVIHTTNIGKINAIIKGIHGHDFPLVTIADADVFYLNNWQKATYEVFEAFPKTGVVCTTPSSKSFKYYNYNLFYDKFWSKQLTFSKVKNNAALKVFAESIENPNFYNKTQMETIFTIENKDIRAVIGAGHFVATYRKEVFDQIKVKYSNFKLGGTSVRDLLDFPVINAGLWRLSTFDNYTYHMGNVKEAWMNRKLNDLNQATNAEVCMLHNFKKASKAMIFIKNRLFAKFFNIGFFYHWFVIRKGLPKSKVKEFFS